MRAGIKAAMLNQRGHLLGWVPVCLAAGIGGYFLLPVEPIGWHWTAVGVTAVLAALAGRALPEAWAPLGFALMWIAIGTGLAGWRSMDVSGPVLGWRYYGPVEGRVVGMDRSASDAARITLDQVRLARVPPHRTPDRVRISLYAREAGVDIQPGMIVMTTAHLSPPQGPVEPGGFDFRRHSWFQGLGAVGYTRVPIVAWQLPDPDPGLAMRLFDWRMQLGAALRDRLSGQTGAVAAAITTGDRSGIDQATLDALRATNLAHLLAISGLHMGLVAATTFSALRLILVAVPGLALFWPVRKWAAAGALVVAAGYLALSGANVATERAFVMVAVGLGAVMLDRQVLSLRAVAVAATIVLTLRPEALTGPGFQMSFAATTALVVVFNRVRFARWSGGRRWWHGAASVALASAVAGLATAPVSAAHFNTFAHYGLIANLLSVPLMGVLIMPAALLAAALAPFGAEAPALFVMGVGLDWILMVADMVAGWPGARGRIASPPAWVLPVLALGALWFILWQGRGRVAGLVPMLAALVAWQTADTRPQVLVAEDGALVGLMTPEGRALSRARGSGFAARVWLENDGDPADQATAAARWRESGDGMTWGARRILHLPGKRAAAAFTLCQADQIVISPHDLSPVGSCRVLDGPTLAGLGSLVLEAGAGGEVILLPAAARTGARFWNPPPPQRGARRP